MLGLTGIHTFVSDSRLDKFQQKKYLEHSLIIQAVSAWWWKKINGPIHLYTTEADAEFLKELKIFDLYDSVNTELLSKDEDILWPDFNQACRMRVVADQTKFPFAILDNALIFRTPLEENDLRGDLKFLYREVFLHRNHPPIEYLGKRADYNFPSFLGKTDLINPSLLIWSNPQLIRDYWALAQDYMKGNREDCRSFDWVTPELSKIWKNSYVEQRLLSALVERDSYNVSSLFPLKYSGDIDEWVDKKGEINDLIEIQQSTRIDFYQMRDEKSAFYDLNPPICTGDQIRTFYRLISVANELRDEKLTDVIEEIIIFTIEKTFALGLDDFYQLRTSSRFLLK
jgi:hypothetical protein